MFEVLHNPGGALTSPLCLPPWPCRPFKQPKQETNKILRGTTHLFAEGKIIAGLQAFMVICKRYDRVSQRLQE